MRVWLSMLFLTALLALGFERATAPDDGSAGRGDDIRTMDDATGYPPPKP